MRAAVVGVGDGAAEQRQREHRHELHEPDQPEVERRASVSSKTCQATAARSSVIAVAAQKRLAR